MKQLRRYAQYLQAVMAAASEGQGGVAEAFETVDDVLARCAARRAAGGLRAAAPPPPLPPPYRFETLQGTNQQLHEQARANSRQLDLDRAMLAQARALAVAAVAQAL